MFGFVQAQSVSSSAPCHPSWEFAIRYWGKILGVFSKKALKSAHIRLIFVSSSAPATPVGVGSGNLQPLKTQEASDSSLLQLNTKPVNVLGLPFITFKKYSLTWWCWGGGGGWLWSVPPIESSASRLLMAQLFASLKVALVKAQVWTVWIQEELLGFSKTWTLVKRGLNPQSYNVTWFYIEILKTATFAPKVDQLKVKKPQFNFFF